MSTGTSAESHAETSSHAREPESAAMLHWLMFTILMLTVPAFYLQLDAVEPLWRRAGAALYAFVAVAFSIELIYRQRSRRGRVRSHSHRKDWSLWLDVPLIIGAAGSALSISAGNWSTVEWALRSMLLVVITMRLLVFLRRLFSRHDIVYVVGLGAAMLALAGAGFYWLEPTVRSYADGLWLAFESGATVGYGDIVPTTPSSRLFAAFMVLLGYALMSLVTAGIAAAFVGEDERRLRRELHEDIKALRNEVGALRAALTRQAS